MKQVIILRTDLQMRRGKEVAQGAHASLKAVLEYINHPYVQDWLSEIFTKIAVGVEGEDALIELYNQAISSELPASLILDNGLTEFGNMPTYTAVAVGPGPNEEIDPITGHLELR